VDLLINRTRDIAAATFFLTVGLAVGMVFAADLLHNQDGFIFFPVRLLSKFVLYILAGVLFL
jgi:hypothetical protein